MPFRTDLAIESGRFAQPGLPQGVARSERDAGSLKIQRISIETEEAAKTIGKPVGEYITITTPPLAGSEEAGEEELCEIAQELASLLPKEGLILVVGLGNNDITPDAIGPRTIHQVLATRHIAGETARQIGLEGLRPTAAIAPGVLGQTGIESSEIVQSVVDEVDPAAVIVVDALASRSAARLGCTIQIASSGISPGSGVMNTRRALSRETLGVPVVSVGVPTVVDASTLAGDLLRVEEKPDMDRRALFEPHGQQMMVTPRDIDQLIGHACKTLSMAINKALQPQLSLEEIGFLAS